MSEENKDKLNKDVTIETPIVNKNMIVVICVHEWIEDYIDICPETSKKICYCVKCNVTKK
jgi:hypothetical protein